MKVQVLVEGVSKKDGESCSRERSGTAWPCSQARRPWWAASRPFSFARLRAARSGQSPPDLPPARRRRGSPALIALLLALLPLPSTGAQSLEDAARREASGDTPGAVEAYKGWLKANPGRSPHG